MAERPKRGGKRPGAGRPKTSDRDDVTVKMDRNLVAKAKFLAEVASVPVAQIISEAARNTLERDFEKGAMKKGPKPPEPKP